MAKKELIQVEDTYIKDLEELLPPITEGDIHFTVTWIKIEGPGGLRGDRWPSGEMGVSAEFWPQDDRYYWPLGEVTVAFTEFKYEGRVSKYTLKYPSGIFAQESAKNAMGASAGPTLAAAPFFREIIQQLFQNVSMHHGIMDRAQEIMEGPKANPVMMNPEPLIIVPYGRKLQSAGVNEVMEAWNDGKDFVIQDIGSRFDGQRMSIRNAGLLMESGLDQVQIRFNQGQDSIFIDLATNREVTSENPGRSKRKPAKRKPAKKRAAKRRSVKMKNPKSSVSCPHCKARAGRPCVNPSGGTYGKLHAARVKKSRKR